VASPLSGSLHTRIGDATPGFKQGGFTYQVAGKPGGQSVQLWLAGCRLGNFEVVVVEVVRAGKDRFDDHLSWAR